MLRNDREQLQVLLLVRELLLHRLHNGETLQRPPAKHRSGCVQSSEKGKFQRASPLHN